MRRKQRKKELNVDFIGSQDALTKEEELKLREHFQQQKEKRNNLLRKERETA